ncbi:MAG: single-stranded DNA-binding protein [Defluviitaleaceae bacterium]|nr:single-stranded DNA-binding protein [Defluviitaleaceae bacterium]
MSLNTDLSGITNRINLFGKIETPPTFSHDVFGEGFYGFDLSVPRLSDASDLLPITISGRIMEGSRFAVGQHLGITGQIRSYNNYIAEEGRNRLVLTVFAKDYKFCDDFGTANPNDVLLDGFICKPPVYRTTPFGREITDLLLAVNRSYNKSDYIPCITWGRNARYASKLLVGDNVKLWGRMQSRIYQKKMEDDAVMEKTAFEVSVSRMEVVDKGASDEN